MSRHRQSYIQANARLSELISSSPRSLMSKVFVKEWKNDSFFSSSSLVNGGYSRACGIPATGTWRCPRRKAIPRKMYGGGTSILWSYAATGVFAFFMASANVRHRFTAPAGALIVSGSPYRFPATTEWITG